MICRFYNWVWRLLPGAVTACLVTVLYQASVLAPLERSVSQGLFRLRGARPWDDRIVLIAIDDDSLQQLGRFPWARQRYTALLNILSQGHPSIVAINLLWSESSPDDNALAAAIALNGRIVLAEAQGSEGAWLPPVPQLRMGALAAGHVMQAPDPDGLVRQIQPQLGPSLAFSLTALQAYGLVQEFVPIPSLAHPLQLNWVGPASTLTQYAFADVIQGQIPPEAFQDKIVLVGVTATGVDAWATPFDRGTLANGVHLQATAIHNGLQGNFLQVPDPVVFQIALLLAGPLLSSVLFGRSFVLKMGILLTLKVGWCLLGAVLLGQAFQVPMATPLLLIAGTAMAVSVGEQRRENSLLKQHVQHLWQTYHFGLEGLDMQLLDISQAATATVYPTGSVGRPTFQLSALANQLGRSQAVQNAIAQSLPIGLLAADRRDRIWFCNPLAQSLLQIKPGDYLQQALVPHWLTLETWNSAIAQLQKNIVPPPYTIFVKNSWFELRWQPLPPPRKVMTAAADAFQLNGFLLTLEDISTHKQVETDLEMAKTAAEQANVAKSEFLANMSHELRTPLNAILGFSDLMADDSSLSRKNQNYLDVINRSGQHLLGLINNVLDMAKIEARQIELYEQVIDLPSLLDELYLMVSLKAERKGLKLSFEYGSEVPKAIEVDGGKLRQVILNLVDNGIKFTQAGWVRLRLYVDAAAPTAVSPTTYRLRFEVTDTGPGIAKEEISRIFRPFEQTSVQHPGQTGTGLGLAISQQFIQLMGGEIWVESILGQGSTFRFTLSAKDATAGENRPALEPASVLQLAPGQPVYRLLVIEDQPDNRKLLTILLTKVGFQVWEAQNGAEGLEQYTRCHPHAVLMDIRMPTMDGYEAIRKIRMTRHGQQTIIIAVTSGVLKGEYETVLAAGGNDIVSKPVQPEVLFDKLAVHLGVNYTYRPIQPTAANISCAEQSPAILQPKDLDIMSETWIAQLHAAALECRDSRIYELLEQIPEQHTQLSSALLYLTNNFQFDKLIQLTDSVS